MQSLSRVLLWHTPLNGAVCDRVLACRAAKQRFDEDEDFKTRSRQSVTKLQSGDPESLAAWGRICEASRREFAALYDRLGVKLEVRSPPPRTRSSSCLVAHPRTSARGRRRRRQSTPRWQPQRIISEPSTAATLPSWCRQMPPGPSCSWHQWSTVMRLLRQRR